MCPTRNRERTMKKFVFAILCASLITLTFSSCRTIYTGHPVSFENTISIPSQTSYKYLGTYCGTATEVTKRGSIADDKGLVYLAKKDLLDNIKKDNIDVSDGNIRIVNIAVEQTSNRKRVVVSVSADVIQINK